MARDETIRVCLEPEQKKQLKDLAKRQDVSVSSLVSSMIQDCLSKGGRPKSLAVKQTLQQAADLLKKAMREEG